MGVMDAVRGMSTAEKLALLESLWDDLRHNEAAVPSPDWHAEALAEAQADFAAGRASFVEWSQAKERLRRELLRP
jgi:hypothetical protein